MEDLSIVLSGEAGQGMKTVEQFIDHSLRNAGVHFLSSSEVMSRIRGGNNTTEIRLGGGHINAYSDRIDILIVLNNNAIYRVENRLHQDTVILGEPDNIEDQYKEQYHVREVPINQIAKDQGGKILVNTVTFGMILGILQLDKEQEKETLRETFSAKGAEVVNNNIAALEAGYQEGGNVGISFKPEVDEEIKDYAVLSGTEAFGLGALAGGCNFIASYPMSPSTGVLMFLAKQAQQFGVVVEQAEDEIAAINMSLGSWYAGGRAMVTTSGGGFSLMQEGLSLSGIAEIPTVVHLAQRPGPATGLPTRTEQGDLNLAYYAGHGEFPRIILTPGHVKDVMALAHRAFNLADKYQVPVVVLTDQYLLDSHFVTSKTDMRQFKNEYHIHQTAENYKSYELTESGFSTRGIPGNGKGYVCIDSDEHDEWGRITEDAEIRKKMVDKRLRKEEAIKEDVMPPEIIGPSNYSTLIIGWGSTYGAIKEALEILDRDDIAFAYFKQVCPLPEETSALINQAEQTIVIEQNATAQFAGLIKLHTGLEVDHTVLQYNGMPLSVETVKDKLSECI